MEFRFHVLFSSFLVAAQWQYRIDIYLSGSRKRESGGRKMIVPFHFHYIFPHNVVAKFSVCGAVGEASVLSTLSISVCIN